MRELQSSARRYDRRRKGHSGDVKFPMQFLFPMFTTATFTCLQNTTCIWMAPSPFNCNCGKSLLPTLPHTIPVLTRVHEGNMRVNRLMRRQVLRISNRMSWRSISMRITILGDRTILRERAIHRDRPNFHRLGREPPELPEPRDSPETFREPL